MSGIGRHGVAVIWCCLIGGLTCVNLDPFLFSGQPADAYLLDSYTGEMECRDALDSAPPPPDEHIRQVEIASGDASIFGIYCSDAAVRDSADTIIVYFHGKSDNIDRYWARIRLLYETGFAVLAVDYRGFGLSGGTSTEASLYEDGRATLAYVRDNLGNPRVVVYSYSLGSIIGCEMAIADGARERLAHLVLEAPIGSIETIVKDGAYLNIPASYVTSFEGDNSRKIRETDIPLLWLHGTEDETLDRDKHGLPIWNNYAGSRGCAIKVAGCTHTEIPTVIGYRRYIELIGDFIRGRDISSFDATCK
jgi:pimeloyl-ACP methyl ester carboxylesterase